MLSKNNVCSWIASKSVDERAKIFKAARSLVPVQEAVAKARQVSVRAFTAEQMKLKAEQKHGSKNV